jgi:hypothetical protein
MCLVIPAALIVGGSFQPRNSQQRAPGRGMVGGVFVSDTAPQLRLRVDTTMPYLGVHTIRIGDIADGERHVFADTADGRVRRLLVLQFERILPSSSEEYRYPITNPVRIGRLTYRHSIHVFSVSATTKAAPENELAATVAFLTARNLTLPDELVSSRYATIIGADRKRELLIFYQEPLLSWKRGGIDVVSANGALRPEHAEHGVAFAQRALRSFRVVDMAG